jgi:multiple sugar transport system ATP-binding protein
VSIVVCAADGGAAEHTYKTRRINEMAEVELTGLTKKYGGLEVIPALDLRISDGEFVVLIGPSGCGKSTLLRMIAGLEEISGGELRIGGRAMNDIPPAERNIAMVFQNYALYPHKTVAANMGFSLRIRGIPSEEISKRVRAAAETLGLTPYLDRFPRALSGGQRQRVAMGRAIVRDPSVFLFDEPLSNLDAKLRVKMRTEIRELHERLGTTTIYVTHDQLEAMTMADKIVLLQGGKIEQAGTPLELYDRPKNMFVAGFIGSPAINLLPAQMHEADAAKLLVAGGEIAVPSGALEAGQRDIMIGIRPEHLVIASKGIRGIVSVVEPTGAESHVVCDTSEGKVTVVMNGRTDLHRGMSVHLNCPTEKVHLFDSKTTNRITSALGGSANAQRN